jgi:hypothetical protein
MAKIHLLICSSPISGGSELEAVCGEKVPNAQAIPLADLDKEQSSTILFCKRCFGRQYFYAISSAQEAMDVERTA